MAFYPPKVGLAIYKPAKANNDTYCFVCGEVINKGEIRYVNSGRFNLCTLCYNQWGEVGGILGDIPRSNHK